MTLPGVLGEVCQKPPGEALGEGHSKDGLPKSRTQGTCLSPTHSQASLTPPGYPRRFQREEPTTTVFSCGAQPAQDAKDTVKG